MKIIAWNINGIRAAIKKPYLYNLINTENPDIFCLGETKMSCPHEHIDIIIKENIKKKYYSYWSLCNTKKGYSGTIIFTKIKPLNIIYGLNINNIEYDNEGRVITCEYNKYYLIHVYTPNSGQNLSRLEFRTEIWDIKFKEYIQKLQEHKNIILCGDLNVAHTEIDLKNPKANERTAGYTIEERNNFNLLLNDTKLIDAFRFKQPTEIKYSYWSYKFKARQNNNGWRIDYFLLSDTLKTKIISNDILTNILGSDHAPIILQIKNI
jgi:exodeoxyribonuclease-3